MNSKLSTFPLLRLPNNAKKTVISTMDTNLFIGLSILSKRAKALARSSGRKCRYFEVVLDENCKGEIGVRSHRSKFDFYATNDEDKEQANFMNFNGLRIEEHMWKTTIVQNFSMRTWLKHLLYIFNFCCIDLRIMSDGGDLELIRNTFDGFTLDRLFFDKDVNEEYVERVLQYFPCPEAFFSYVRIGNKRFSNMNIQNIWHFVTREKQGATLNNLLSNNSKILEYYNAIITPKELNRFLKLWMENSNPQLQWVYITLSERHVERDDVETVDVEKEVMKGIHHQVVPIANLQKSQDYLYNQFRFVILRDGCVIHRKDGTKAAVHVDLRENVRFQMIILP